MDKPDIGAKPGPGDLEPRSPLETDLGRAVVLREVQKDDLPIFFEQQLEPEAIRMAAFPSRAHDAFMAHWAKILADQTCICRTILFQGDVAGNIGSWGDPGERKVGYWLGKQFWGKGIATAALSLFLRIVKARPLYARVVTHNVASIRVLKKCGFTVVGEDKISGPDGTADEELILRLEPYLADGTTPKLAPH